jgi:hypothetical protein
VLPIDTQTGGRSNGCRSTRGRQRSGRGGSISSRAVLTAKSNPRVVRRCSPEQARGFDSYTFDAFAKSLVDRFLALAPGWWRPPRGYRVRFPTRNDWDVFQRGLNPPAALGGIAAARALRLEAIERWGPLPLALGEPEDRAEWVAIEWWRQNLSSPRPLPASEVGAGRGASRTSRRPESGHSPGPATQV